MTVMYQPVDSKAYLISDWQQSVVLAQRTKDDFKQQGPVLKQKQRVARCGRGAQSACVALKFIQCRQCQRECIFQEVYTASRTLPVSHDLSVVN